MTSRIKVALALTLLLAAPVGAAAASQDRIRGARLRPDIRREIRESMLDAQRARMEARQMVRRAMAWEPPGHGAGAKSGSRHVPLGGSRRPPGRAGRAPSFLAGLETDSAVARPFQGRDAGLKAC